MPKESLEHHDHSARDGLGSVPSRGSGTQPKPTRTPALHQHTSHHTDTHAPGPTHTSNTRTSRPPNPQPTPKEPNAKPAHNKTQADNKPQQTHKPTTKTHTNPNKSQRTQQNPPPNKTHHHHQNTKISAHGFEPRTFCMLSRRDNQLHHAGCAGTFTFGIITTRSAELQSCPLSTFQRASPAGQCHLTLPLCAGIRPPSSELVRA